MTDNPNDQALFLHSQAIARKALDFMGRKRIPATPENYMIFYYYFEGETDRVKRLVDEHLATDEPWDTDCTSRLFCQLFNDQVGIDMVKRHEELAQRVAAMTRGLMNETTATAELASKSSQRISSGLLDSAHLKEVKEVASWLRNVLNDVSTVAEASRTFGTSLQEKNLELEKVISSLNQVERMVLTDELTQLPNRRAWDVSASSEFNRFRRYGRPAAVIMIDLDRFKNINDQYGHIVGDQALRQVAILLSNQIRATDFIARYGGEEFACLMPETSLPDATSASENLRRRLENVSFTVRGKITPLTASFGVAAFHPDDPNHQASLDRADQAMYMAKTRGRNKVCSEDELSPAPTPM